MKKFVLIKQHYDMPPGTIVYKVGMFNGVYTINPDIMENNLRIVPDNKLEEVKDERTNSRTCWPG